MSTPTGFSGVGKVTSYTRSAGGLPAIGTAWGNCPSFKINHAPNVVERNSSMEPTRGPLRRMTSATGATVEIVCDEFNKKNFARATLGRVDSVVAAADQTYTFPMSGVVAGDVIKLPHRNVSNVVIKDSTPVTAEILPEGQYEVDEFDGSITILDITAGGPYVQPLKAEYDKGAVSVISGLALPEPELWVGMSGVNVDTGEKGVLDVYRVRFAVADVLDFINSGYQDYTLKGSVLLDTTKTAAGLGGQYYQFVLPTTVS